MLVFASKNENDDASAAAAARGGKPKILSEVIPFTRESLEKIHLKHNNLIRDYGFLPKRAPSLIDGAQLPAKYEPFPVELIGKPVEEIDPYVYDKVGIFGHFATWAMKILGFVD